MCRKIKIQDKDRGHQTYYKETILDAGRRGLTLSRAQDNDGGGGGLLNVTSWVEDRLSTNSMNVYSTQKVLLNKLLCAFLCVPFSVR